MDSAARRPMLDSNAQEDLQDAWTGYSTDGRLRHGMKTMQRQTVQQKPERPMHGMQRRTMHGQQRRETNAFLFLFAVESFTGGCTIPQFAGWLISTGILNKANNIHFCMCSRKLFKDNEAQ